MYPLYLLTEPGDRIKKLLIMKQCAEKFFLSGWVGAENIKYKFRFAPKFPSICINQECSILK